MRVAEERQAPWPIKKLIGLALWYVVEDIVRKIDWELWDMELDIEESWFKVDEE